MTWSLMVDKNIDSIYSIKTGQLFSKHFRPGLSFYIFYFRFYKGKDNSAIAQPNVHHLVYVSPIFFCFHKWFNNFHLNKISFQIRFFIETYFSSYFYFHGARELSVSF